MAEAVLPTPECHVLLYGTNYCCMLLEEQYPVVISKIFSTSYVMNSDQSEWAPVTGDLGPGSPCWPAVRVLLLAGGLSEGYFGKRLGQQEDIQGSWGKGCS